MEFTCWRSRRASQADGRRGRKTTQFVKGVEAGLKSEQMGSIRKFYSEFEILKIKLAKSWLKIRFVFFIFEQI
jgi:hypothetical protein